MSKNKPKSKITIIDVAKEAGVSIKTVSRVLNNEPNVRQSTRDKVEEVARRLDFHPNLSARRLAGSRSFMIALAYDNPSLDYIGILQQGAVTACRENGYHLLVEPMGASVNQDFISQMVRQLSVDGVILTPPVCDDPTILEALREANVPTVRIAPQEISASTGSVRMDDKAAAHAMTEHLIATGHRDIAFIRGHENHGATINRYQGFEQAMVAAGLQPRDEWILDGDFSFASGSICGEQIMSGKEKPTAIFASNDDMAAGVMAAMGRLGLSVPEQVSVAGCDDGHFARSTWPQLTTIKQPIEEMGKWAAQLLIEDQKKMRDGESGRMISLDFELIIRGSTRILPSE
ncbi:MAG: LacI family DNA-binding transcriptional regulator [Parvularculaceae bacterium]